jgi:hypothetical protein
LSIATKKAPIQNGMIIYLNLSVGIKEATRRRKAVGADREGVAAGEGSVIAAIR